MAVFVLGQKKVVEIPPDGGLVVGGQKIIEISTPNDYIFHYLAEYGLDLGPQQFVVFRVKARNDAHIALSRVKGVWTNDTYEIVIGGWNNQRSAIRPCVQCNPVAQLQNNPMDENVYKSFWISWTDSTIRVGFGEEPFQNEFLSWTDPNPHEVNYVGLSTGWGALGNWIFGSGEHFEVLILSLIF